MKQKRSPQPQPMAIPLKNRFEALQAQDPCASQPQETIIENIKKKRLTKEKSNQTAHSLDTSPITTSKSNAARTSTPAPRSAEKNNTTTYNITEKPNA